MEGLLNWTRLDIQLMDSGDVAHHPYMEQLSYFAECLDADKEALNNAENAFESHCAAYASDKSAETGKPVSLSEFRY